MVLTNTLAMEHVNGTQDLSLLLTMTTLLESPSSNGTSAILQLLLIGLRMLQHASTNGMSKVANIKDASGPLDNH